jgi:hypothetical protein
MMLREQWRRRPELLPIAIYALLALLVVPIYPHFLSPNEFSRWVVNVAIVEDHTLEVSRAVQFLGSAFEDLSIVDGRLYSNKAPGAALVALPAYAAARTVTGPPTSANLRFTLTVMRLMAATLPALLLALLVAAAARRHGCSEPRIVFAVVTLLFATPLFAYGLLLFSHALAAFALFAAWLMLFSPPAQTFRGMWNEIAAGAAIGLAVLSEYPLAIAALLLILCALPSLRLRGMLRVALGGLPFAVALGAYNAAAFGSPFSLGSGHEAEPQYRALAQSGIFGIGVPSPAVLLRILFDPSKGLFILSPILLLAFAGLQAARRALPLPAFVALLVTPAAIVLTYAGYPNWHGGWTVGVRYVVAALPFLALLIAFTRTRWIDALLLGASALAISLTTLIFPFVPPAFPLPWASFAWPLLRNGLIAPNLLHAMATPLALSVPFAAVALALLTTVRGFRSAIAAAGATAMLLAGIAISSHYPLASGERLMLGFIEEVQFGVDGAVARALPPGASAPRVEERARRQKLLLPDDWPFRAAASSK